VTESRASPVVSSASWLGAFAHRPFAIVWGGETLGLIGIAMFDAANGWLMSSLNPNPLAVSLVQAATSLPMFLFTYPAGALADMIEARRFLIIVSCIVVAITAAFATLVQAGGATPFWLLSTTFALSAVWALNAPAWMAITPLLVLHEDLDSAVAANTVGYNISRAIGPTLGAFVIAAMGIAAPFWAFCLSNLVAIAALVWWRAPAVVATGLPAERFASALRVGVRHAANNPDLIAAIVRTVAVFPFATAYWALLPLVARQSAARPEIYGVLLAAISLGAILGALLYGALKPRLGADGLWLLGALGTALALALFGLSAGLTFAFSACLVAGASWIVVLTSVYVAAQDALPGWVRGRGVAILLTAVFGAMTAGSAAWGEMASAKGLPFALFAAGAGALVAIPAAWPWRLRSGPAPDLSPSLHWPSPKFVIPVRDDQGPVLVIVAYRIEPADRSALLAALDDIGRVRRRDGAFAWGVFEDGGEVGAFREMFMIESWNEFLHVRERFTRSDRALEDVIHALINQPPKVSFHIAADRGRDRPPPASPGKV
jgi:MFS family permease